MIYNVKKMRWVLLGALCLAQMAVMIDNTILNVALPSVGRSLNAGTTGVQGVVMAYSIAQAATLLTVGAIADQVGNRKTLIWGLLLFGLGSAAAAFSPGITWLIVARVVMGLGGACLMASTLAVITLTFEKEERVKAIGLWAATGSAAFMAGPLAGGALLKSWWWGSIFLVNLPLVLITLVAVWMLLPRSPSTRVRIDGAGMLTWAVGISMLLVGITLLEDWGWAAMVLVGVGVMVLLAFVWVERGRATAMLPTDVLLVPAFRAALIGAVVIAFAMGGSLFLLTLDLQVAQGVDPLAAGVRLLPLAATVVLVNSIGVGARATSAWGTPVTVAAGMGCLGIGMGLFPLLRRGGEFGQGGALVLMGLGIGLAMPAMANALMSALPPSRAGIAAGINGTVQELGASIGVAVLGAAAALAWSSRHHGPLISAPPSAAAAAAITVGQILGALVLIAGAVVIPTLLARSGEDRSTMTGGPSR